MAPATNLTALRRACRRFVLGRTEQKHQCKSHQVQLRCEGLRGMSELRGMSALQGISELRGKDGLGARLFYKHYGQFGAVPVKAQQQEVSALWGDVVRDGRRALAAGYVEQS